MSSSLTLIALNVHFYFFDKIGYGPLRFHRKKRQLGEVKSKFRMLFWYFNIIIHLCLIISIILFLLVQILVTPTPYGAFVTVTLILILFIFILGFSLILPYLFQRKEIIQFVNLLMKMDKDFSSKFSLIKTLKLILISVYT